MKEYPIIFSGAMVRAILEDRKTMTRRPVKVRLPVIGVYYPSYTHSPAWIATYRVYPPWRIRDRLWVKETWCPLERNVNYKADTTPQGESIRKEMGYQWRSPRFMPRWASRELLEVTATKIERLQDIEEIDAIAEGVDWTPVSSKWQSPIHAFHDLWDSIYDKKPGLSWADNPWVLATTFRRVKR